MSRPGGRRYATTLLRKARADYGVLLKLGPKRDEYDLVFGFHAHQAVEKALKAGMAALGLEFPYIHNIALLLDVLRKAGVKNVPAVSKPGLLTVFAVEYRYEEYEEAPPKIDRGKLTTEVEVVINWAGRVVKNKPPKN